jgi:multidrug efflux pump subunit AcrB
MTTLARCSRRLPLMLGFGRGRRVARPLGLAIFGGLDREQLLTRSRRR